MNLNYEEIKKLIEGLFNKYNGLVNICVPARLEISPIKTLNSNKAGDTAYPNTVIIYPTNIINYSSSTEELISYIAETVIHELYHIDQLIDTTKINSDYAYNNSELIIFIHDLVDACSDKEIYLRLMILCKIKKLDVKRVYLDLSNSNGKLYEVLFKCIKWEHDVDTTVNISADKKNIDKVKVRKRMEK